MYRYAPGRMILYRFEAPGTNIMCTRIDVFLFTDRYRGGGHETMHKMIQMD